MKQLKRYIPYLVDEFINKSDYKQREHLYVICDMLNRIKVHIKKDKISDFIDIPAYYFTEIIKDKNNYQEAKNWLIDNKIIQCDGLYSKDGGKALGYKFSDEFNSKLTNVAITKPTLFKRITKNINEEKVSTDISIKSNKEYLINNLKIDYNNAITYIDNLYNKEIQIANTHKQKIDCINRYNSYFMSISAINDGYLFMRKNKTNGRVDSNLTSLKKELKQFIYPKNLYQIDIVNSQPFFLYFLIERSDKEIKPNKDEMEKYLHWCRTGKFYENFYLEYNLTTGKTLDRPQVKKIIYTILFGHNECQWAKPSNDVFKFIFPSIFKFVSDYKKEKHNKLAIDLQKLESSLCIDVIVPMLNIAGVSHFTIHDAWLVDSTLRETAKNIVSEAFYKTMGTEPKLEETKINENIKNPYQISI